jgi:hypothetical protein
MSSICSAESIERHCQKYARRHVLRSDKAGTGEPKNARERISLNPFRSLMARDSSPIACRPFVNEYKLHRRAIYRKTRRSGAVIFGYAARPTLGRAASAIYSTRRLASNADRSVFHAVHSPYVGGSACLRGRNQPPNGRNSPDALTAGAFQRPASEGASSPAGLTTKASRGCFNGYDQIRAVSAYLKQRQFDRCRALVSKLRAAPAAGSGSPADQSRPGSSRSWGLPHLALPPGDHCLAGASLLPLRRRRRKPDTLPARRAYP